MDSHPTSAHNRWIAQPGGTWHVTPINLCPLPQGASTRNRLLDEAWGAEYAVFWDDDIAPQLGCLDAYIASFKEHPTELAFAGDAGRL